MVPTDIQGPADWIGTSPAARGTALTQLLDLADALPQGLRCEGSPSLVEKVVAVDQALATADLPHAFGGGIALAYYGEPRTTIDIDANVFAPIDRWPQAQRALADLVSEAEIDPKKLTEERQALLPWDRNPIHLFFSYDQLHEEMPQATRRVPLGRTEIPIVGPEHLVIRKAILGRAKDWLDIEAILLATERLDLDAIASWLERLVGPGDPRVTKMRDLAVQLSRL